LCGDILFEVNLVRWTILSIYAACILVKSMQKTQLMYQKKISKDAHYKAKELVEEVH
jgi:hypothetical protein